MMHEFFSNEKAECRYGFLTRGNEVAASLHNLEILFNSFFKSDLLLFEALHEVPHVIDESWSCVMIVTESRHVCVV